jgi:CheY-like chemotaxis protein
MYSLLVVEDDSATREAVIAMLEELGHDSPRVVTDGVEAIESLRAQPSALMMLDLMMPRMDGFEVLRELRRGSAPRPGHIIVMSAHANSSDRAGITELGADQFLSKPFTLEQLRRALDAAKKA